MTETLLLDDSLIILKYNVFIDRAPCTKLHKREQKDTTKTLGEFPNHVLKDYGCIRNRFVANLSVFNFIFFRSFRCGMPDLLTSHSGRPMK
jgi:hypothetical protein